MEQTVLDNSSSLTLQKQDVNEAIPKSPHLGMKEHYDQCYSELLQQTTVIILFHEPLINTQVKIKNSLTHL